MSDLTIFVNTHSSAADCWNMFCGQLNKHWPDHPQVVIASNKPLGSVVQNRYWPRPTPTTEVDYSAAKKFSSQYLMGLCGVRTDFVLTLQEDMLLYADVDEAAIVAELKKEWHGAYDCSRLIDSGRNLRYSMQASIWKTRALRRLYAYIEADTPWDAEIYGHAAMLHLSLHPCRQRRDDHLPMRGRDHRDSPIFPYVSTALVRGKWNSEYRPELEQLHREYGIDAEKRGWSA